MNVGSLWRANIGELKLVLWYEERGEGGERVDSGVEWNGERRERRERRERTESREQRKRERERGGRRRKDGGNR
jgi:hypothetical protein